MIGRQTIEKISARFGEAITFLGMRFILSPAARFLPEKLALAAANVLAATLLIFPSPGMDAYWHMRQAIGRGRFQSLYLAWRWLVQPLCDFVICSRLLSGRKIISQHKIIEKNIEAINSLRKSGESYIVACGHFAREAIVGMFLREVTPGNISLVSNFPPEQSKNNYDRRISLQLTTLLKTGYKVHEGSMTCVYVGENGNAAGTLYANLSQPGNVVFVNIDAPYESGAAGSFSRPFAGARNRSFALGAVGLARLAQCPIISCVCWRERDGSKVIEWGEPIKLNERGKKAEDIEAMNKLLDRLEVVIGRRPEQYILGIDSERRWNQRVEKWEDL